MDLICWFSAVMLLLLALWCWVLWQDLNAERERSANLHRMLLHARAALTRHGISA